MLYLYLYLVVLATSGGYQYRLPLPPPMGSPLVSDRDVVQFVLLFVFVVLRTCRTWVASAARSRHPLLGPPTARTTPKRRSYCMTSARDRSPMTSSCRRLRHRWRHITWSACCCDDSSRTDSASIFSMVNRA